MSALSSEMSGPMGGVSNTSTRNLSQVGVEILSYCRPPASGARALHNVPLLDVIVLSTAATTVVCAGKGGSSVTRCDGYGQTCVTMRGGGAVVVTRSIQRW